MPTPSGHETYISYGAYPFSYMNGLQLSNNATTPNTLLNVGPGVCIDSTNTFQMVNDGTIVINAAFNGLNGLDTGSFAAGKVYAVFLVSDPVTLQPIGAMLSLSYTQPLMPFSYSAFKLIGYATTAAGGATFLKGAWTVSNTGDRLFMYDAPLATAITAGTSTSYANVNLIAAVPNVSNLPVLMYSSFTPAAASDLYNLQPGNATGSVVQLTGQVASVAMTSTDLVLAQPVVISSVSSPVVNYKVSAGTAAVSVAGYYFAV